MPGRPAHPCSHPGCGVLVDGGDSRCPAHRRQANRERDDRRGSSTARGYGFDWQRLRRRKLQVDPLCEDCRSRGRATLAEEVDHIQTIANRPDLRLVWDNLQSLCGRCHRAKTASQRTGKPMRGCGLDGTPTDPAHPWNAPSD